MKLKKVPGASALMILYALLFGAPSALAENTALCSVDELPCSHIITHVHQETLTGSPAILLTSVGNVKFDALFLSNTNSLASPLSLGELQLSFTNAVRQKILGGTESCTISQVGSGARMEVLRESHETAKVTFQHEVNVHCGSVINCTYDGQGLVGTAKGPLLSSETNGEISVVNQTLHSLGTVCPETSKLDITLTPLVATYIST